MCFTNLLFGIKMKIGITGHTQGLGLAITQQMTALGHEVIGFSRTNGYDISDDATLDRIVSECTECDVFINNAVYEYAQTKLLYKLHNSWEGKDRQIVNIGSKITMLWVKDHHLDLMYRNHKKSLDDACEFLNNRCDLPKVMLVKIPRIDTQRVQHMQKEKLPPSVVADLIIYCILHPKITISEIGMIRP